MAQQSTTQLHAKTSSTTARRKKLTFQLHPKRRGNPDWAIGLSVPMNPVVCEFERVVARLKLKPDEYAESAKLREWAEANKDVRYVPERLLKAWGIPLRRNIEDFI